MKDWEDSFSRSLYLCQVTMSSRSCPTSLATSVAITRVVWLKASSRGSGSAQSSSGAEMSIDDFPLWRALLATRDKVPGSSAAASAPSSRDDEMQIVHTKPTIASTRYLLVPSAIHLCNMHDPS